MKVTQWTTRVLQTPADNPLVVGIDQPGTREFVTLEVDTDEGLQGIGVTFFGGPLTPALRTAVDNLCELIIGEDPLQVEAVTDKLRLAAGSAGPEGIFTLAKSQASHLLLFATGTGLAPYVSMLRTLRIEQDQGTPHGRIIMLALVGVAVWALWALERRD